ncbi:MULTISPECIES: hypothetical protein [Bacillaceae]|uniref:Uncharacterized protein n=1 Tax=Bacillus salipaludis TaxID=2547811 RepID=A0A4R5VZM3_9BACI|nr:MULTISPECIES: hypothetical protein [Bacillaceae]MBI0580436.1 hypothetical protein [Neobacillus cucumis]MDQ6596671.1 hypothetical protein [Bacillus salipaludis]MDR7000759.1 hypothetical protein [Neobacillus niacini]MED1466774.1 hypothetical protein [Bacillus salipaludis]TDK65090.1 hypothetical protein E2K98_02270 [Bacillus salipaludis]
MRRLTLKLTIVEVAIGILFLLYEFLTGHPWTVDGVPWTMDENFHFNIALGFFVGAGFTFIMGAIFGSTQSRDRSYKPKNNT